MTGKTMTFPEKGVYSDGSGKTFTIEKINESKPIPAHVDPYYMAQIGAVVEGINDSKPSSSGSTSAETSALTAEKEKLNKQAEELKTQKAELEAKLSTLDKEEAEAKEAKAELDKVTASLESTKQEITAKEAALKAAEDKAKADADKKLADIKAEEDRIKLLKDAADKAKTEADAKTAAAALAEAKVKTDKEAAEKVVADKEAALKLEEDRIKALQSTADAAKTEAETKLAEAKAAEAQAAQDKITADASKAESERLKTEAEAEKTASNSAKSDAANLKIDAERIKTETETKKAEIIAALAADAAQAHVPEEGTLTDDLTGLELLGSSVPEGAEEGSSVAGWEQYKNKGQPIVKNGKIHFIAKDSSWFGNDTEKFSVTTGQKIKATVNGLAFSKEPSFGIYEKTNLVGKLLKVSEGVYEGTMLSTTSDAALWMYGKNLKIDTDYVEFSSIKLDTIEE